jgi:hypothetical protein
MTATAPAPEPASQTDHPPRRVPLWACLFIGVGGAVFGLLPWIATGMRLPLQNLWATETAPHDMPLSLLPFSQYSLTLIFGLIVVGSAAAGIAARAVDDRLPRGGFFLVMLGLLATQAAAIVQPALVLHGNLQERTASTFYLGGLIAVCVASVLVGLVALLLIARAPRAGALLGLTVGAIAAGPWLGGFFQPLLATGSAITSTVVWVLPWITPVLVGIAIAWTGVNTVGRVIAALIGLALLWIAPAAMTAISSAAGSRVLARDPLDMIDYAIAVFQMALFTPEIALRPIIAAVVVAVVGLVLRWSVGAARRRRATGDDETVAPETAAPTGAAE